MSARENLKQKEASCEEVPPSSQNQSELPPSGSQGQLGPWTPRVTCPSSLDVLRNPRAAILSTLGPCNARDAALSPAETLKIRSSTTDERL